MKKVLVLIHDMRIGGAQKSLLSFLKGLEPGDQIDLMVIDPSGAFYSQIPEYIRILPPPKPLRWMGTSLSLQFIRKNFSLSCLFGQLKWMAEKHRKNAWNLQQRLWHSWKKRIPTLKEAYDVAIAYIDGAPGYYVMEKVTADKKVLWVHSEYQKLGYDPQYDRPYYEKAHKIVTVSEKCRQCILQEFPQFAEKTCLLENITLSRDVLEMSTRGDCPEYREDGTLRLLTVARLNPMKGVDLAVEAARLLKEEKISFQWLVIGDGSQRQTLQAQIEKLGLGDCIRLLGSRENPYPYMAKCHILVQPSRVEGKSIVLDEAKILKKPIVATAYETVGDTLVHEKTGYITPITPQGIARGITVLWQDAALRQRICENLTGWEEKEQQLLRQYRKEMF